MTLKHPSLRFASWLAACCTAIALSACGGGGGDAAPEAVVPPAGSAPNTSVPTGATPAGATATVATPTGVTPTVSTPVAASPTGVPPTVAAAGSKVLTANLAIAEWPAAIPAGEKRPVLVYLPGWNGTGNVNASVGGESVLMKNQGYVTLAIGFTSSGPFQSDIQAKTKEGLDKLCADTTIAANCAAIVIVGGSYGGSQIDFVTRNARANGYSTAAKNIVGFLSTDAGYGPPGTITDFNTGAFTRTGLADTANYSVAMLQRQGDTTFPINDCTYGNCGIRVLSMAHAGAPNANKVLSLCPAGGEHGDHAYATTPAVPAWDDWASAAIKTMLHTHRGVMTFTGYTAPTIVPTNACTV